MLTGTNKITYFAVHQVITDRHATYGELVCDNGLVDKYQSRPTVEGYKVDHPFDVNTSTSNFTTAICIMNSTLSIQ